MLRGIDISHHNKAMKDLNKINDYDFVIMKATEGLFFRDPMVNQYTGICKTLKGYYHYARAEKNDPEAEAIHFYNVVENVANDRYIACLDIEGASFKNPLIDIWALEFCKTFEKLKGYKPLIYTSSSELWRFPATAKWGAGLWVAKWGKQPTKKDISPWTLWAVWQYTSKHICSAVPVDGDFFNGSGDQFLKYSEVAVYAKKENN